jgi:hypothetical protein
MNIIELAKKAGMRLDKHNGGFINQSELFHFAELVRAQALEEAVEACVPKSLLSTKFLTYEHMYGRRWCVSAIRKLKEK